MRLWHYDLIEFLPRQQLLSQWRELNSIYKKQDNHILINFVYEYDKEELFAYSEMVISEMLRRGYKIKSVENFVNYFGSDYDYYYTVKETCFDNHMNEEYLKICCWNLYEKYLRGQKGFTPEAIKFIKEKGEI
jgi:uncharacterized protein (TIGR02328 family)